MHSDSLQFIEVYSTSNKWVEYLPKNQKLHLLPSLHDLKHTLFSESYSLLILQQETSPQELFDFIETLPTHFEKRLKIIYINDLSKYKIFI